MRCKITFVVLIIFFTTIGFGQSEKLISGKIVVKNATPSGVHIINLVNEKEVISDEKGEFKILAKVDDLLVFSSVNLDYQRKIIETNDFSNGFFTMEMTSKINQLDEVEVVYYEKINAVDLGILPKKASEYTPAERRLKTATSLDPTLSIGNMAGGSISLDPLINAISGRTKQLKRELEIERKEFAIKKLTNLYSDEFFVKRMKIAKENVNGFKFFCVENEDFRNTLKSKNKTLLILKMSELSIQYNKIVANEKS